MIRHAKSLVYLLKTLKIQKNIHAVEVGVYRGEASEGMLSGVPNLFLTMVDTWSAVDSTSDYAKSGDSVAKQNQCQMNENKAEAIRVTDFAEDRRKIMQMSSLEAAVSFEDESLDLVFIDAEHTYDALKQDILAWWPRVRSGGVLCGHDYGHRRFRGVKRAADEFALNNGLELIVHRGNVWSVHK